MTAPQAANAVRARAAARRAADKAAVAAHTRTSDLSDDYTLDTAFLVAAQVVEQLPTLELIETLVPDHPKHAAAPRQVTARVLIAAMVALPLSGRPPHLTRIAAVLCSHRQVHGRNVRVLRKKTRSRLGLPKNSYVSRAMVQHTHDLVKAALEEEFTISPESSDAAGEP